MSYLGQQLGQGQAERFVFTASGGETSVTTSDDGRAVAYTVGQVDVYLNGAKLINGSDFTATTGTSITGLAALTASDVVEVFALSIFQAADTVSAASGGTFNGNVTVDANLSVTGTVDLNGGTIDGTVIGGATPAAGSFTTGQFGTSLNVNGTVTADGLTVDGDTVSFNTSAGTLEIGPLGGGSVEIDCSGTLGVVVGGTSGFTVENDSGESIFEANLNGDISFYEDTGTTPKFFWDASAERLGLGTTSPFKQLHLAEIANNDGIFLSSSADTDTAYIFFGDTSSTTVGRVAYDHSRDQMEFFTSGSPNVVIDSNGNFQVGTTNIANDPGVQLFNAGNIFTHIAGTGPLNQVRFYRDNALVGNISTTGTATSYNTSSDYRLKENIADAEDASEFIDAIQVRSFDWKADGSHQRYGMVAQELMTVAPEAVSGDPESDDMMGVDYSKLVPMLVKEIQSLRARVAQLEGV